MIWVHKTWHILTLLLLANIPQNHNERLNIGNWNDTDCPTYKWVFDKSGNSLDDLNDIYEYEISALNNEKVHLGYPGGTRSGLLYFNKKNTIQSAILGKWSSQEDSNWRLEFKETNLCIQYYTGEPNEEYAYTISNSSPQCGYDVLVDDTTSYLQLVNKATGESLCYEINGIAQETLSLRPVNKGGIMLFNRE